jgi:hypothetical protein
MNSPILAPVVALVAWTLVMLVWMLIVRSIGMWNVDPKIAINKVPTMRFPLWFLSSIVLAVMTARAAILVF